MSQEKIIGKVLLKDEKVQYEWYFPPRWAALGEELSEVITETIDSYFKEKGLKAGPTLTPKKRQFKKRT